MKTLFSSLLLAAGASAHTIFQEIAINGVSQGRYNAMRLPTYDGPITDVTSGDLTCNGGPNPLVRISPNVVTAKAGDQVTLYWAHTLDTDYNTGLIIDASHNGPMLVYMAKVANATGPIPRSGWFKIYEDGYANGRWAVQKLIADKGKVTVTIPSCIAPGDYLLRGELIALHGAGSYPGAQLYMECAQLRITSDGNTNPTTYNIPGVYSGSDPGIRFNLYGGFTSYQIPGPRPFSCSGAQPQPSVTNPPPLSSTSVRPVPSATPSPTPSQPPVGTVPQWGQCGGVNWTGGTVCISPYRCVRINDYYSQCQ